MNDIKNGRMKALQPCGCGCGVTTQWHRLGILRGPDDKRYYVLEACREQFEAELDAMQKLKEAVFGMSAWPFYKRCRYARLIFALQLRINARRFGWPFARRAARRSVAMLCLPKWMALMLARVWKR